MEERGEKGQGEGREDTGQGEASPGVWLLVKPCVYISIICKRWNGDSSASVQRKWQLTAPLLKRKRFEQEVQSFSDC